MKTKRGYKKVELSELAQVGNSIRNYVIDWSYTFAPKAVSQFDVHIGLGSVNHSETLEIIFKKEFGTTAKIIAIWQDVRQQQNVGIGTPNSYLDLE